MLVRRSLLAMALVAGLAALAVPAAAVEPQNANWHVHDGHTTMPGHLGIAFFPTILYGSNSAENIALYLEDPATCPNATDKALLPSGLVAGMPLRAGVCFTSTKVIQVRTIGPDEQAPGGDWTLLGPTDGTVAGGPWVTYYRVTDR